MTEQFALQVGRDALTTTLLLSAPPLVFALAVGLVISVFQAVTQINELTLSFVPKMLAVFLCLGLFGPWMISTLLIYTNTLFAFLPTLVR